MSRFGISVLKPAQGKKAVKRRLLDPNGALVKSDHTLFVKMWLMANVSVPNDARLGRGVATRDQFQIRPHDCAWRCRARNFSIRIAAEVEQRKPRRGAHSA